VKKLIDARCIGISIAESILRGRQRADGFRLANIFCNKDGNGFKRYAVLFMSTLASIISKLVLIELLSRLLESKSGSAVISHT
jgi:hypothetical protein